MSNMKLIILGVLAVVMVFAAVFISADKPEKAGGFIPGLFLMSGLNVEAINSISYSSGDNQILLNRVGQDFRIANKEDYPAFSLVISGVFAQCFTIKKTELITSDQKNFEDLGVTDATAKFVFKFFDADNKPVTGFYVSQEPEDGKGPYVRLLDGSEAYRIESMPFFPEEPVDYADRRFGEVAPDRIEQVTLVDTKGTYTLKKTDGAVVMDPMPAGTKLKGTEQDQVFSILAGLLFDDVKTAAAAGDAKFDWMYACKLTDSLTYVFSIAKQPDGTGLVRCRAEADDTKVFVDKQVVDSDEIRKEKSDRLMAQENKARFNLRHKGWVYQVSVTAMANLTKSQAELLEDVELPVEVEIPDVPLEPVSPVVPEDIS